jgi:hypothetical protein
MINCTFKQITIADLFNGYVNNDEEGVYTNIRIDGELIKTNIRPPYQREFVYNDVKRNKVIETLTRNLPLGIVYLARNEDGTMEVIDGQQRITSICEYLNGAYSVNGICEFLNNKVFDMERMSNTEIAKQIMSYDKLLLYIVEGSEDEKLEWFRTINISGERLTEQELLNANYVGEWLTTAKRMFSKTGCKAYRIAEKYVKGSPIRQEFLETALAWISGGKENIVRYMSAHQHDENANALYDYFEKVIEWVKATFPTYRKEMKGIDWGKLYAEYKDNEYDVDVLEEKIVALMADEDVTNLKGVYEYVLSNCEKERCLSIRAFTDKDKTKKYNQQKGICPICGEYHTIEEMEGDHIIPWSKGGKTTIDNLQMLCKKCNREKSNI